MWTRSYGHAIDSVLGAGLACVMRLPRDRDARIALRAVCLHRVLDAVASGEVDAARAFMPGNLIETYLPLSAREREELRVQWEQEGQMTSSEYIEQEVVERLRALPLDKQQALLDFAEFLRQRAMASPAHPRQSVRGLWADLAVDVIEEDIDQARREMWATFPRDIA